MHKNVKSSSEKRLKLKSPLVYIFLIYVLSALLIKRLACYGKSPSLSVYSARTKDPLATNAYIIIIIKF